MSAVDPTQRPFLRVTVTVEDPDGGTQTTVFPMAKDVSWDVRQPTRESAPWLTVSAPEPDGPPRYLLALTACEDPAGPGVRATVYDRRYRPGWDDYFLGLAKAVSARGECERTKVGAVLVGEDRRIIATGYNGVAPGQASCLLGLCPRARVAERHLPYDEGGPGACIATHAEDNAVSDAARRGLWYAGATMYVTREPCERCAAMLLDAGITAVWPGGRAGP